MGFSLPDAGWCKGDELFACGVGLLRYLMERDNPGPPLPGRLLVKAEILGRIQVYRTGGICQCGGSPGISVVGSIPLTTADPSEPMRRRVLGNGGWYNLRMPRRTVLLLAACLALAAGFAACSPAATATQPPASPTVPGVLTPYHTRTPTPSPSGAPPTQTPFPTATPTPVTYTVQKNDDMFGIALRYGVSLPALKTANPTVLPNFLSVGIVLVIPVTPPPPGAAPSPQASATPAPVTLDRPHCYPVADGGAWCLALARNTSDRGVENITALFRLSGWEPAVSQRTNRDHPAQHPAGERRSTGRRILPGSRSARRRGRSPASSRPAGAGERPALPARGDRRLRQPAGQPGPPLGPGQRRGPPGVRQRPGSRGLGAGCGLRSGG